MSDADVAFLSLVGMSLRRISPSMIVTAKIMARQAGLGINRSTGITTSALEAHALAGGRVFGVIGAMIAARQAGMDLDFTRAAAIDLAGRNVLEAVQTSITPKIIDCPSVDENRTAYQKTWLSAVAKDGIEMRVRVRVTVRTCLDQLIGGATEQTVVARVGQGIVSTIGSANTYMSVMSEPDRISKSVLARGLDSNTAFEIVSIDIAEMNIGDNIGARLQTEEAEANMRVAQAAAESRKANAIALEQEMRALSAQYNADVVLAEAEIPLAIAEAFRKGQMWSHDKFPGGDDRAVKIHRPTG